MRRALLLSTFACLLGYSSAMAQEDLPRMMVGYYVAAFTTDNQQAKRAVLFYLSGIRDHLWWNCEYKTTVPQLIQAGDQMINAARKTQSEADFINWASNTPYGDMIFVGIRTESANDGCP